MIPALPRTLLSLTSLAALGGMALASDNGWCHLTPWTSEAPADYESFGRDVALEGEWAAVSASGSDTVRIFHRDGGIWTPTQTLGNPALDIFSETRFGTVVVLDEGRLFISDPRADLAAPDGGAVFRYEVVDGQWQLAQTLTSPSPVVDGWFGQELDVDGPWLVARETVDQFDNHVEVFRHDGVQWLPHTTMSHPDGVTFGTDLAVRDTATSTYANVFVADSNAYGGTGAAFHFRVHPFGYQIGPSIQAPVPETQDVYASTLAFDGEHLVVGAGWAQLNGTACGAAYVYDVDGEVFPPVVGQAFTIWPEEPMNSAAFGVTLAVEGKRLVVGARGDDVDGLQSPGSVSVFRPDPFGTGWHLEDRLLREGAAADSYLGMSAALDGDLVLAGATGAPGEGGYGRGEAVLFSLTSREMDGGLAPSDVLATVEHYGEGKAGQLGVPDLHLNQPLVPGESSLMGVSKVPEGTSPFIFFGLEPGQQAFDGGALLVAEPHVLALPVVSQFEQIGWVWDVPPKDELAGFELYIQVMLVDPLGSGLKQTSQSRGMRVVIGY